MIKNDCWRYNCFLNVSEYLSSETSFFNSLQAGQVFDELSVCIASHVHRAASFLASAERRTRGVRSNSNLNGGVGNEAGVTLEHWKSRQAVQAFLEYAVVRGTYQKMFT